MGSIPTLLLAAALVVGGLLFCLAPIAVVVLVLVYGFNAAKRRRQEVAALARELGFDYSEADPLADRSYGQSQGFLAGLFDAARSGVPGRFGQFGVMSIGGSRRASNVFWGTHGGRRVMAFDYQYSTGSGKHRNTRRFSAVVATLGCRFPELVIRPENFLDKIAAAMGLGDIDFESHELSRCFCVRSRDRKLAYDIVHAGMMDYLLAYSHWSIELDGADVLIWTGRTWSPEEFRAGLAVLQGFLDRVPRFVWKELGETREAAPKAGGHG